jgi:4'-phosphopantetheinyl transferase
LSETRQLADGVVDVWRGSLDQPPEVRERLFALLDADERDRARAFRFDVHRHRYVVGRGILRVLLGRYLGSEPARLRFRYGPERKPELADASLRFNLAHADASVVYAFSSSFDVGVDVELLRPERIGAGVAERFFSPAEVASLQALPERDRPLGFFSCWTRKEAVLKARGDGLTVPLASFDVSLAPGEAPRVLRTGWAPDERTHWQLVDLSERARGEIVALAAPVSGWAYGCRDIDITTVVLN